VDVEELKTEFGFTKFYLINDFEANGYGATIMDTTNEEK
jgi:glucokinase